MVVQYGSKTRTKFTRYGRNDTVNHTVQFLEQKLIAN